MKPFGGLPTKSSRLKNIDQRLESTLSRHFNASNTGAALLPPSALTC